MELIRLLKKLIDMFPSQSKRKKKFYKEMGQTLSDYINYFVVIKIKSKKEQTPSEKYRVSYYVLRN